MVNKLLPKRERSENKKRDGRDRGIFFRIAYNFRHANLIKYTDARHTTPVSDNIHNFYEIKVKTMKNHFIWVIIHSIPAPFYVVIICVYFFHFLLLTGIRFWFFSFMFCPTVGCLPFGMMNLVANENSNKTHLNIAKAFRKVANMIFVNNYTDFVIAIRTKNEYLDPL